jgi:hypothetical protein
MKPTGPTFEFSDVLDPNKLPDHVPTTSQASQDELQHVVVDDAITKLPQHVAPLFEAIRRYGHSLEVERAMRSELAFLLMTKWRERLALWVRTHQPNEVPPIVFYDGFAWVNRSQRRSQR